MDLHSCLLLLCGLAFILIGIGMKLRKKDDSKNIDPHVIENAVKPKQKVKVESQPKPQPPKVSYGPIHIMFGSQTGTAANFAKVLGEEAEKIGFTPKIIDLVDFDPETLKAVKLVIFLMATHGEGEPTDNAKEFNQWLTSKERTEQELNGLKFTVFGLGNKQYQFFNAQGKLVNKLLEKLGGQRVYRFGEGDDNESLEDDFNEWKTDLWESLKKVSESSIVMDDELKRKPRSNLPFIMTATDQKEIDLDNYDYDNDKRQYEFQMKQYFTSANAKILLIKELRQKTDDGSTLHIELDSGSVGINYKTADNLAIFPENTPDIVERVSKLLGLILDTVFVLNENKDLDKAVKFKYPFPTPISVRTYLTKFCDLRSTVRKKQLKDMAEFCTQERNKERLLYLSSPNGKIEFEAQIQSRMLGLIDILEEFDVQLSLSHLIQISSLIQPRYYTIASSNIKHPNSIHLCFTMQLDILPDGSKRLGLTSYFLTQLFSLYKQGQTLPKVKISIKESTFQLPTDPSSPVYMVGPGAGIAPFRGFVEEKDYLLKQGKENPFGEMTLYFGCRGRNWDYLYKEELLRYHEEKVVENYYVAFSRENVTAPFIQETKTYVQNLLDQNQAIVIRDIFERNGTFYVCGGMGMGKSVMNKLADFACAYYKMSPTEGAKKIEEMEKNKKIIKELWG